MTPEVLIPRWQGRASCPLHQTLPSLPRLQRQALNSGWEEREKPLSSPVAVSEEPSAGPLAVRPYAHLPCPGPAHLLSADLIPPVRSFASPLPWEVPSKPSSATLGPNFPLLWPKPGLSLHLAEGLEKPRSATSRQPPPTAN